MRKSLSPSSAVALALLLGCLIGAAPTTAPAARTVDHSAYDAILRAVVRDGRVDYLTLRKRHYGQLVAYLDALNAVDADALPRDERLAMYINLYDATMLRTICERLRAGYTADEGGGKIFKEPLVHLGGRVISLDDLEHHLIRAGFHEPRVHACLVCGGLGCPPMFDRAYTGAALDRQLDQRFHAWVNDASKNAIDAQGGTAVLSSLFKYYAADFGGEAAAVAFVGRYSDADLSKLKVSFSPTYDWTLNAVPPAEGRWVALRADATPLLDAPAGKPLGTGARGDVLEVTSEKDGWLRVDRPFGAGEAWINATGADPYAVAPK